MLTIDVFKDADVFTRLGAANDSVREVCATATFAREGEEYDLANNKISYWFNPARQWHLHVAKYYPHRVTLTHDPKFNLVLYCANYPTLWMIDRLYRATPSIMIEDQAAGMGFLVFYLARLGFRRFHVTERFTQVSQTMLERMMAKAGDIEWSLNDNTVNPVVINLSEWTHITRERIPESCELLCVYNNPGITYVQDGVVWVRSFNNHVPVPEMVPFARDADDLMHMFCRRDRYDEFRSRIAHFESPLNQGVKWA